MSRKQAHLFGGFAYSTYKKMLISKCEKAGVETTKRSILPIQVEIGNDKFMKKYGLSSYESAALTILRKAMNFNHIEIDSFF